MRNAVAVALSVLALGLPYADVAVAATEAKPKVRTGKTVTTKTASGPAATAGRWGTVQVTIVVRRTKTVTRTTVGTKTTTKTKVSNSITDVKSTYEVHTDRSQFIMEQALPLLRQEVLQAQSANVQLIGHATDTSEAFLESLQAAISQLS